MSCVQHIRRMNENGVKKMCRNVFSLQQTLTSITLAREPALDYARAYFELLCLTPEVCISFLFYRSLIFTELIITNNLKKHNWQFTILTLTCLFDATLKKKRMPHL